MGLRPWEFESPHPHQFAFLVDQAYNCRRLEKQSKKPLVRGFLLGSIFSNGAELEKANDRVVRFGFLVCKSVTRTGHMLPNFCFWRLKNADFFMKRTT